MVELLFWPALLAYGEAAAKVAGFATVSPGELNQRIQEGVEAHFGMVKAKATNLIKHPLIRRKVITLPR